MAETTALPTVVQAGEARFPPAAQVVLPRVESRHILLCRSGQGTLVVNGRAFALTEGAMFILPWACNLSYTSDETDPFAYAGTHLIPQHTADAPIAPGVAKHPEHQLAGCTSRRDDPRLASAELVVSTALGHPDLADIVQYAARVFGQGRPPDNVLRGLGALVAYELASLPAPRRTPRESDLPADLRRLVAYIDDHLDSPLSTVQLVDVVSYSESTLNRRFHAHLHTSPMAWVTERRLRHARDLLQTTSLPVSHVARRCGFSDPFYFSRLFRQHLGDSPTSWRRTHRTI